MRNSILQFSKFIFIGLFSAFINYASIILLVDFLNFSYLDSKIPAFLISLVFNYFGNKNFTFQNNQNHLSSILKYSLVLFSGLAINIFITYIITLFINPDQIILSIYFLNIKNYMFIEIFISGIIAFYNFFGHKFFTFR